MIEELSLTVRVDYLASVIEANVREVQRHPAKAALPSSTKPADSVLQDQQATRVVVPLTATGIHISAASGDSLESSPSVKLPPATDSPLGRRAGEAGISSAHPLERTETGSFGEPPVVRREASIGVAPPATVAVSGDPKAVEGDVSALTSGENAASADPRLRSKSAGAAVDSIITADSSSPVISAAATNGQPDGGTPLSTEQSALIDESNRKLIDGISDISSDQFISVGETLAVRNIDAGNAHTVGSALLDGPVAISSAPGSGPTLTAAISNDSVTSVSADNQSGGALPTSDMHSPSDDQMNTQSSELAADKSETGDSDDNVSGFDEEDSLIEAEMNRIEKEAGHARRAFESRIQKHKIIQVLFIFVLMGLCDVIFFINLQASCEDDCNNIKVEYSDQVDVLKKKLENTARKYEAEKQKYQAEFEQKLLVIFLKIFFLIICTNCIC